ncbi:hypothetical protein ABB27_07945 [Stenotrophomonas terrae]|uniref:Cyclic di-GMP receptor atypical PilZ domain-containing protein n=1 Tax=Stenotrophomonas terrae TaxID=405446 RepID=A0A0R0CSX1_9GAMM|nr:PilZ domain-containing protein [Stenotrophomonas terrae]KRG67928.1 hypothetical protein ABB27_07945 [Stenotrophomonas terrae]
MNSTGIDHPAETELFDDTLSCELSLPVEFQAGATLQRPGSTEMLLRSIALVEDARNADDGSDERNDNSLQLQRLEARLDLTLVLLGRLLQRDAPAATITALRWSRHGLRLQRDELAGYAAGTKGVVRLQPAEWLPDLIELPVVVLAEAATPNGPQLWVRLDAQNEALLAAVERHLFRLHRKQIADSRRNR